MPKGNPNPTRRRPSDTLASRQITVRVPVELAEIIDTVRQEAGATTEATLTLGRWLMLGQQLEQDMEKALATIQ